MSGPDKSGNGVTEVYRLDQISPPGTVAPSDVVSGDIEPKDHEAVLGLVRAQLEGKFADPSADGPILAARPEMRMSDEEIDGIIDSLAPKEAFIPGKTWIHIPLPDGITAIADGYLTGETYKEPGRGSKPFIMAEVRDVTPNTELGKDMRYDWIVFSIPGFGSFQITYEGALKLGNVPPTLTDLSGDIESDDDEEPTIILLTPAGMLSELRKRLKNNEVLYFTHEGERKRITEFVKVNGDSVRVKFQVSWLSSKVVNASIIEIYNANKVSD